MTSSPGLRPVGVADPASVGAGGAVLVLGGAALYYGSLALAGYAALFAAAVCALVIGYEEPTLRATFDAEYDAYCRSVPRWWPRRP